MREDGADFEIGEERGQGFTIADASPAPAFVDAVDGALAASAQICTSYLYACRSPRLAARLRESCTHGQK
jgi:hypothetical protein